MSKQQTAVDWLVQQYIEGNYGIEVYEQAKAMEKQQIIEAFKHGELPPLFVNYNSEQYYNETYGE